MRFMKVFCNFCGQIITNNGVIADGSPLHHKCKKEKDLSDHAAIFASASEEFSGLFHIVRDPQELLDKNILEEARKYPWVTIYRDDFNELAANGYNKKAELMSALGEWASSIVSDDGIDMDIICILFRKEVWWKPGDRVLTLTIDFDGM